MVRAVHISEITVFDPRTLSELAAAYSRHTTTCIACQAELAPLNRARAAQYVFGYISESEIRQASVKMLLENTSIGDSAFEDATEAMVHYYLHLRFPKKK